uniref:Peptidase S1 domain-containing protein n=1 Tax=Anopheles dirus TaxID=7168 RepID=A0A182N9T8_9DIPT
MVCGMPQKAPTLRVLGGADVAPPNKYPWIALLQYYDQNTGTGTLINDRVVLTTATIVSNMIVYKQIKVIFGTFDPSSAKETASRKVFAVTRTRLHPQYTSANPMNYNIGLLQLATPVAITDRFMPICLPSNVNSYADAEATLAGWGARELGGQSWKALQETTIPLYSSDECRLAYPNANEDNICGGVFSPAPKDQHKSSCDGDDGVGLMYPWTTDPSLVTLIGINLQISDVGCGRTNQPAIFTKLYRYIPWTAIDLNQTVSNYANPRPPFSPPVQQDLQFINKPVVVNKPANKPHLLQQVLGIAPGLNSSAQSLLANAPNTTTEPSIAASTAAQNDPLNPNKNPGNKPNLIQQLLGNAPGQSNNAQSFFSIPSSTTAEPSAGGSNTAQNDPLPNPAPGLINSTQSALSNASNVVQGFANQWGTNVPNGLFASLPSRPSNDEAATGTDSNTSNPVQSLIDNSQASWNNATGIAQGLFGQFGSNVQNGITNVFGFNVNRPSNDEPVAQSTEASATTSSPSETSTEAKPTAATTSKPLFPLVSFVNTTQSLVNSSTLGQTITSSLPVTSGFAGFFIPRPNRPNDEQQSFRPMASKVERDFPVPPAKPSCSSCSSE